MWFKVLSQKTCEEKKIKVTIQPGESNSPTYKQITIQYVNMYLLQGRKIGLYQLKTQNLIT